MWPEYGRTAEAWIKDITTQEEVLRREVALSLSFLAPFMTKKVANMMGSSMLCDQ